MAHRRVRKSGRRSGTVARGVQLIITSVIVAAPAHAQVAFEPLAVVSAPDNSRLIGSDTPLQFTLNRPLSGADGSLIVVVGGIDVTALVDIEGTRLVYRPAVARLPAGESPVVLYVKREGRWSELSRTTLRVSHAGGFERIVVGPTATIGNRGQLASGRSSTIPDPERETFQDFVLNAALSTTHARPDFTVETSSNYVGVSRQQEALRFGTRQDAAPRVDLSDYRVTARRGTTALTLGHTSFGGSRHLVNGFSARGAALTVGRGTTTLTVGALNGSPLVGWDHLVGFNRAQHRILGVSLGGEIVPARPGLLRVEGTVLDASVRPIAGFRQGAVLDAEQSSGGALQFSAATPDQRLRLSGGLTRSRFGNPATDTELLGDTVVRAVERETNWARYLEGGVNLLQGRRLPLFGTVTLGVGFQHERVDPLYRSVPASAQADLRRNASDATLSLGVISGQFSRSTMRDNLAGLRTILTTAGEQQSGNVSVPVAQLLRSGGRLATLLPMMSYSASRTHQYADGMPEGGAYKESELPDQVSLSHDVGAQWQLGSWRVGVRHNRARQDNRQAGRALSDFSSGSDAVSLSTALGRAGEVSLDVGDEFQRSEERDEQTDTRRATVSVNLRRGQGTSIVLGASLLRTTPPNGQTTINGEQRVELVQPLAFLRDASGSARGQFFLRFGRSTSRLPDFSLLATNPDALTSQRQWTVSSGLNLRAF
jgi:hypothetical protein